jgi:mono/diheme cytochrome c family protein
LSEFESERPEFGPSESAAARLVFFAGAGVVVLGVLVAIWLRPAPGGGPPPPEIADDPLLVRGRQIYHERCISCHGPKGKGDGPIAAMAGPTKVGDLSDDRWAHGDAPEQVLRVVSKGVPGTSMAAWAGTFDEPDLRAVAAYVYHLAGREVPGALRAGVPDR